jgi:Rod binding domain-containing protein
MNQVALSAMPLPARRTVEQPAPGATDAQLRQAAQDFETIYLAEMLTKMGAAREPDTFGGGFGAESFQSLLNEAYAERIVERGGTGIAEMVYRQLRAASAP